MKPNSILIYIIKQYINLSKRQQYRSFMQQCVSIGQHLFWLRQRMVPGGFTWIVSDGSEREKKTQCVNTFN